MNGVGRDLASGAGITSVWSKLLALEDRIFAGRRLRCYAYAVVTAYALGVFVSWGLYRGVWAVLPDGSLSNIDFCWIWVSGKLAASSDPSRIYDHLVYAAAQDVFYRPGECLFMHQYI